MGSHHDEHNPGPDAANAERDSLATRAVMRDPVAWGRLFELHYRQVYAFVRYRLARADEAEDIASQVFEVAFSRATSFDYRGVPIEAWLMGIARNLVRDHLKKLGRRGISEEFDDAVELAAPDDSAAADLRRDLLSAMAALTVDQRQVLQLRFLMDRSVAETAAVMGRSEDAVKNLQRRALAAMQRTLLEVGYPVEDTP